jgi:hypothetical protein
MAEDHRRSGDIERIVHRRLADMAEIDQHAQPLHLAHHVRRGVGGAVGPGGVLEMGQRHVARAERVHLPQHRQRAADRMAALHADQRGDPARLERLFSTGSGLAIGQLARVAGDQPFQHVDLLERRLDRLRLA